MMTTGVARLMVLTVLIACTSANKEVSSYSSMVVHNDFSVPESMGGGLTVQEPPKGWPFTDPTLQNLAHTQQQQASKQAPVKQNTQYHVASNKAAAHKQYHHEVVLKPNKQYQEASKQVSENNQQQQQQQSASSQIKQYHVASNQVMGNNKQQEPTLSEMKQYHVASNKATMEKRTRLNGHERASDRGHVEDEDFSPVSFVHSERQKNLGTRKAKGVPQMKHTSAILGQSSEQRAGIMGPRQPRLEALHSPKKVLEAQNFQVFHGGQFSGPQQTSFSAEDVKPTEVKFEDSFQGHNTPKKVVSSQNFQLFHGGKFAGPPQTSFGEEDVKPMEERPLPIRKLKKKKAPKPQGQEPSAVNVGYTIGFVNNPGAQQVKTGPVHSQQVGLNDGILTLANDDIIVGKPATTSHIGATGATGQAASTQSHQIIHMIHTPQPHDQSGAEIPTVHHILHNQPLNSQQLSDIFSNTYEGNKVYSHVLPTHQQQQQQQHEVDDYQIQTVPDHQQQQQQGHLDENGHVMLVSQQQDSPSADTIFYSPQEYRWKNVNGVEVASSIPVTEEQHDDLPNPHHKQPPPQRPPPPPQPQPQPQAQALQQAPPQDNDDDDNEQYLYLPVLEHAPSQQHSQQTAPNLSHHGQTITYSQALPIISGPSGSSSNFDHKKALTHSVGFDYSNAMVSIPHVQSGRVQVQGASAGGQAMRGGQHPQQGGGNYGAKENSFVIVEDEGVKTPTRLNHEELNGDMDIKVEYIDVDANSAAAMGFTSPGATQQGGVTYELPKKTLGLPAEFPKDFSLATMPVINMGGPNIGQHLLLDQNGGSSEPNYAQLFANGNTGLPQNFGQVETGQQLTFGHELPVFPSFNFHGGPAGKGIFKQPNILQLQNGGQNAGIQGFGGQINSNSIYGRPGGSPGHQGFPGHHSGRVMLSHGTFSGEGLPIAGLVEAGVPPFNDLKGPQMNLGGQRPGGHMGNGGFRGGRLMSPPRYVQNFQQGRGQFGQQQQQQNGRMPNQGVIFHQFMLNPQQLVQNQGPPQGRPVQFPQPQQPQQQQQQQQQQQPPPPPPPMNGPIILSMNTLGHHHAVQNAIRNANQHKHNIRQNHNLNQNLHFHMNGAAPTNIRPGFQHHPGVLFHRERLPLKPRENQQVVVVHKDKQKKQHAMQKQRNELAKYNSMLSVALFKPVGKVTSQYFIKNNVKSAEFPITSSFTLDLKPPPKVDAKK